MWLPGWIKFSKSDAHTHTHIHTQGIILYSFIINIGKLVKKMGRKIFYGNLQDINFSKTQLSAYMKTLFFNRFDNSWKNDNDNKK